MKNAANNLMKCLLLVKIWSDKDEKTNIIHVYNIKFFACRELVVQKSEVFPSWNEGKSKQSIIDYVCQITDT